MAREKLTIDTSIARVCYGLSKTTPVRLPETPTCMSFCEHRASDLAGMLPPPPSPPPRFSHLERTFDFLELPAELRNHIYGFVLSHDAFNGCLPDPSLLRVCKQIYHESRDLISNMGVVTINADLHSDGGCIVTGNVTAGIQSFGKYNSLTDFASIFSGNISRFPTIKINISIDDQHDADTPSDFCLQTFGAVNRLLYSLAAHLKQTPPRDPNANVTTHIAGTKCTVSVSLAATALVNKTKAIQELLYPLSKIPDVYDLHFIDATIPAELQHDLATLRHHHNHADSTQAPEVHCNLLAIWTRNHAPFRTTEDLNPPNGTPHPPRLYLAAPAPQKMAVIGSLWNLGRQLFHLLSTAIDTQATIISQRPENRLLGVTHVLQKLCRLLRRKGELTADQLLRRYRRLELMFEDLVASKSPL